MTREEVLEALRIAKWALADMGDVQSAWVAEDAELLMSRPTVTPEQARLLADYVFPPGRRGAVVVALYRRQYVRALAFVATALRSFDAPSSPRV